MLASTSRQIRGRGRAVALPVITAVALVGASWMLWSASAGLRGRTESGRALSAPPLFLPIASAPSAEDAARRGKRLIFFRDAASASVGDSLTAWPDASAGHVALFSDHGLMLLRGAPSGGRLLGQPIFAVPVPDGILASESDGPALLFRGDSAATWWSVADQGVAMSAFGNSIVAARSIREVSLRPVGENAPLFWIRDWKSGESHGVGAVEVPSNALLGELVNTGVAAIDTRGITYFASSVRREVQSFDARGRLRWRTRWHARLYDREPALSVADGRLAPVYAESQLALVPRAGGGVLLLAAADSSPSERLVVELDDRGKVNSIARSNATDAIFAGAGGEPMRVLHYSPPVSPDFASSSASFPPLRLPRLTDSVLVSLADLDAEVIVLNFWASWCVPCRRELPALEELSKARAGDRMAVIGINQDNDAASARHFVAKMGINFLNLHGAGQTRKLYRAIPYTVVLDGSLRVHWSSYGFGGDLTDLNAAIRRVLDQARMRRAPERE